MAKMTKKDALTAAITAMTAANADNEAIGILTKMVEQLSKERKGMSDEAKAAQSAKRKEATAKARAELLEKVAPVLRANLSEPVTAKELFDKCKDNLPEDFTWNKVQNILIREMKPELEITERKKGGNTYKIVG